MEKKDNNVDDWEAADTAIPESKFKDEDKEEDKKVIKVFCYLMKSLERTRGCQKHKKKEHWSNCGWETKKIASFRFTKKGTPRKVQALAREREDTKVKKEAKHCRLQEEEDKMLTKMVFGGNF